MTEFLKLLPADEAWDIFMEHFTPVVTPEPCRVVEALDRALARAATAPHELPTFVRCTVDGYAVQAADTHGATPGLPAYLDVVAEAAMGQQTDFVLESGQAALVHTGGMVPAGADAVVMIEHTNRAGPPMFAATKNEKRKTIAEHPFDKLRASSERSGGGVSATQSKGAERASRMAASFDCVRHTTPDSAQDARVTNFEYTLAITGSTAFQAYSIEVSRPVAAGDNCIQPGEDVKAGELILPAGHTLRPQDIGGLLAVGIIEVQAARRPRVGIVSQGDEVVPPEQEPGPGQVRDVNSYTLAGYVRHAGGIPLTYPIAPDTQEAIDAAVRRAFDEADVVVVTAGSSVSYRDLTANAINALGKPGVLVHGVAIRPGKPTILAVCEDKPVFGLPGNPVSCINIFQRFVTPTIRLLLGAAPLKTQTVTARLARNVPAASGRADYVRVRLEARDGETWAVPVFGKSNLIFTLVRSEGVVEVPLNSNGIAAGEVVRVVLD